MLNKLKGVLFGLGLACAGAASAQYVGNNPTTGLSGSPYFRVAIGTAPAVTGCNTGTPVVVGGANAGRITTVGTTTGCALVLTYTIPVLGIGAVAPVLNGAFCTVIDLTTVADTFTEASTAYTAPTATAAGTLSCTFTSRTIGSGDVLLYSNDAF